MTCYYNEWDSFAAEWLVNLAKEGHIPNGTVDTRSITEVDAEDLRGYTQCHFFAGIAGWAEALRLAGWPADREVWTGSCPCQPFSNAGKRKGTADERHLWPEFFRLIRGRRPASILGEQVVSLEWWDQVAEDLESLGYTTWSEVRTATVQRRRRIFWSANLGGKRVERQVARSNPCVPGPWRWRGEEDLQAVANAPFERGDRWPEPLVRAVDDGFRRKMVLHCAGNAIVPQVAAEFVKAFMEVKYAAL